MVADVVRVDDGLLVVDGHHAIRAVLDEGHSSIRCRVRHESDPQRLQHRREVYERRMKEGLTFASLPVDASEGEREQRIQTEMSNDFMNSVFEQLPLSEMGDDPSDDEIKL